MTTLFLLAAMSYFSLFPSESREAMAYYSAHKRDFDKEMEHLDAKERRIAVSVVLPEVSQYSHILDYVELKSLYFIYLYQGGGDFSVGRFQMKPSFVEMLERDIDKDPVLSRRYGGWLRDVKEEKGERQRRRIRLEHLEDDRWQMRYLTLFMELAGRRARHQRFADEEDRVRYYATLYNSGLHIPDAKVEVMKRRKYFPSGQNKFNYSDISVEFFRHLK